MRSRVEHPDRVLIVVENLPVPYDRRVWLEATSLARAGMCVSVISPSGHNGRAGYQFLDDVHVHRYPMLVEGSSKGGLVVEYLWAFVCIFVLSVRVGLFGRGFDVLQVCNPPEIFWPTTFLWKAFGKRVVFDHHDLTPELFVVKFGGGRGIVYRLFLLMEKLTFLSADFVISTNESYRTIARTRGGKPDDRVFVVRNGPDPARLRRVDPDPAWRRGRKHVVAFLGEIGEQDGVDRLLRTARHIIRDLGREDIQFVILGGGPHYDATVRYAGELDIRDYVTFTGRVDSDVINTVLSTADVGTDPCPRTDLSDKSTHTKIMEYLFFGVPVVASDLTETRVSAADCAVYAEPEDDVRFAERILELIDDPGRARDIGRRGYARVRRHLLWEYSEPVYLETIRKALDLGARE